METLNHYNKRRVTEKRNEKQQKNLNNKKMKTIKKTKVLFSTFGFLAFLYAPNIIDVTDRTIRLDGKEEEKIYYGFAEGDKIVFNFEEINKKELQELEILEYPSNLIFTEYKTKKVHNREIKVKKTGIYVFKLKNSSFFGRTCRIKIQRVPSSEATKDFNTSITWETKRDTTYKNYTRNVIVGYDTTYVQNTKKELVKSEKKEEIILDRTERVHSFLNSNKSYTTVQINLPQNNTSTYQTKKLVAWAYWIGVGREAMDAWNRNVKTYSNIASGAATIMGGGPLAGIAVGTITSLAMPSSGDVVEYWFISDAENKNAFMSNQTFKFFEKGKGVAAFGKNTNRTQGTFYIGLSNDNYYREIDVNIKISVIWEIEYFEDKEHTEMIVKPRYEVKQYTEPVVRTFKIPRMEK